MRVVVPAAGVKANSMRCQVSSVASWGTVCTALASAPAFSTSLGGTGPVWPGAMTLDT